MDPLCPRFAPVLPMVMGRGGVAGKLTSKDITKQIKAGGGKAMLTTVEGGKLTATMQDGKLVLTEEKGRNTTVTIANVIQSNGVIHVVEA